MRGAISVSTRLPRVIRGRLALIGDASGSVDAITGEGLALAFRQAAILAEALSKNDLAIYQAAHRRIGRIPRLMSRLMLGLGGRAGVRLHSACRSSAGLKIARTVAIVKVLAARDIPLTAPDSHSTPRRFQFEDRRHAARKSRPEL